MNAGISEARHLSAESIIDRKTFENKINEAIRESGGNVSRAAEILGVSRRTMCRYIAESQSLEAAVNEERRKNDTGQREYNRRMQRKSRRGKKA
jgi:DNA-binding NtrC family response regulator